MNAYDEGFRARLEGKTVHENPYATFTQENNDWREGWEDQNYHLNGRDEALKSIGWFG